MGKLLAIAHNTFLQTLRQPIYCILILVVFLVLVLTLPASGWSMGEGEGNYHETDQKMMEMMGLSTLLIAGGWLAAFRASSALSKEIEDKTALTVISKPVPRSVFVLGKFAGVAGAVALAYYLGSLVFLMTVRHQVVSAASEPFDWPVIVIGFSALGLAIAAALGGNFFFGWTFTSSFVWSCAVCLTVGMGVILFVGKDWQPVPPGYDAPPQVYGNIRVRLEGPWQPAKMETFEALAKEHHYAFIRSDYHQPVAYLQVPPKTTVEEGLADVAKWKGVVEAGRQVEAPVITSALLAAIGLTFLSLVVLVAVAVTASTRLGLVLTLMTCGGVFVVGTWHPFLFGDAQGNVALRVLGWITPNLTYFYSMDVLSRPFETGIPLAFVAAAALYCALCVMGVLAVGIVLFQGRQMAAEAGSASVPGAVNLLAGVGRAAALAMGLGGLVLLSIPATHTGMGLLGIGILLVLAAGTWFLWSYFSRGAKWSYWLVLVLVCLRLALRGAAALGPKYLIEEVPGESPALTVLSTILAGAILLILLLPKTRRHFRSQT